MADTQRFRFYRVKQIDQAKTRLLGDYCVTSDGVRTWTADADGGRQGTAVAQADIADVQQFGLMEFSTGLVK